MYTVYIKARRIPFCPVVELLGRYLKEKLFLIYVLSKDTESHCKGNNRLVQFCCSVSGGHNLIALTECSPGPMMLGIRVSSTALEIESGTMHMTFLLCYSATFSSSPFVLITDLYLCTQVGRHNAALGMISGLSMAKVRKPFSGACPQSTEEQPGIAGILLA